MNRGDPSSSTGTKISINATQVIFAAGVSFSAPAKGNVDLVLHNQDDVVTHPTVLSAAFLSGGNGNCQISANDVGTRAGTRGPEILTINGDSGATYDYGGKILDIVTAGNSATLGIVKSGSNIQKFSGSGSTYSGVTTINGGGLYFNGNFSSAVGDLTLAVGATLAGVGSYGGHATLIGIVSPGDGGIGVLTLGNGVTWNGGSSPTSSRDWLFNLSTSGNADLLSISGAFNKGSGSVFRFDFGGSTQVGTYTLVDWSGSTTFSPSDFSYVNLGAGLTATFAINGSQLDVTVGLACDQPTITLGANPTVCQGTASASVSYSATAESPTEYSIDYDVAAASAGFVDVGYTAYDFGVNSSIPISVPVLAPVGTYHASIYVRSGGSCPSAPYAITVSVISTPAVPGNITQGNPSGSSVCSGSFGVTYSVSAVSSATTYTWTVPAGASITAGQGTTQITVDWSTASSGNITVNAENQCGTSADKTKAISVETGVPIAPTVTAGTDVSTTAFTANWNALPGVYGYYLDISESPTFSSDFVVNNLNVGLATSYSVSSLSEGLTYYYRIRAYNNCGTGPNSLTAAVLTPSVYAGWDTSGLTASGNQYGPQPFPPTTSDSRLTVGPLTRGPGVDTATGNFYDRSWGVEIAGSIDTTPEIATNNGRYADFSFQADAGLQMSFYAISTMDISHTANRAANIALQYSIENGPFITFTNIHTPTLPIFASIEAGKGVSAGPIDLRGVEDLQNIPDGSSVRFRIIYYGLGGGDTACYFYDIGLSTEPEFQLRGTFCSTPAAYSINGGGNYCTANGGATVGLSGSQVGVSYQLYRNGGLTAVGSPVEGTGSAISFGLQAQVDTYTVVATRIAGGCEKNMNGSVSVTATTSPDAPTGLIATPSSGQVGLSWTAPASGPVPSAYKVKRGQASGGPYTTLSAGQSVVGTTFTDTTALNGNFYFYVVTALNGGCESTASIEAEAEMPQECPAGIAPVLSGSGNITVTIGNSLNYLISASEAAPYCTAPTISQTTLPSGMS